MRMIGEVKTSYKILEWTKKFGIAINSIGCIKQYVDTSYAIHDDRKGHRGSLMTMSGGGQLAVSLGNKRSMQKVPLKQN